MLLPHKAMLWEKHSALLLSDLHLGKISHFRKEGIPLPSAAEDETLCRLNHILINQLVRRVIILGDLFHSHYNNSWKAFIEFLGKHEKISFDLVMGNHDVLEEHHYVAPNLTIHGEHLIIDNFYLTHHPRLLKGYYNICGHIHPAVKMNGRGKQGIKLPCFHFRSEQAFLPAFGFFTGSMKIEGSASDHIYAIADSSIIKVL